MKTYKKLISLTQRQLEVINGSLLGDASISWNKNKPHHNSCFFKGQSRKDNDGIDKMSYMNWMFKELDPYSGLIWSGTTKTTEKTLKCFKHKEYYTYNFKTCSHPIFGEIGRKWYKTDEQGNFLFNKNRRIKIIPKDLKLTPLIVCVWYMDDGSNWAKDANLILCTNGFTTEECEFLIERLKIDVGINHSCIHYKRSQPTIFVGRKSYFDFIDMMKEHVSWDCFKYKIDTNQYKKKPHRGERHSLSKMKESQIREMFEMEKQGISSKEIAEKFDVTTSQVAMVLNGKRWKHLGLCTKKLSNRCKPQLTDQQRQQIKKMIENGMSKKEVAEIFDVNQTTIWRVAKNENYIDKSDYS